MLLFLLEIKGNISIRKLTISILIKNRLSTSNKDEPLIKFFKSNTIFLTSNGIDIFPYHLLTGPLAFLYPLLEIDWGMQDHNIDLSLIAQNIQKQHFTLNQPLQPAAVPGIFPSVLSTKEIWKVEHQILCKERS